MNSRPTDRRLSALIVLRKKLQSEMIRLMDTFQDMQAVGLENHELVLLRHALASVRLAKESVEAATACLHGMNDSLDRKQG